jgi:hypothetical protein
MDFVEYLNNLRKKLRDNQLTDFWIMCNRKDFNPIKGLSEAKLEEMIKEKSQYYIGKKIANIRIFVDPSKKTIDNDKMVIRIAIVIMHINEDAKLDTSKSKYLTVNYYTEELEERKFKLKDVERMMRLCVAKKIKSDPLNGITFSEVLKKLKKKDINLDDI